MARNGGNGVIALLVVIIVLLVGGFVYYEQVHEPDVEIELPDVQIGK